MKLTINKTWVILIAALLPLITEARPIKLDNQDATTYALTNDRIAPFMAGLLSDLGVKFEASSALKNDRRTLNGKRQGTPQQIFDSIVSSTGILLYYDGTTVYGYSDDEQQRSYISIETTAFSSIISSLEALNLTDKQNIFIGYKTSGLIEVSGAPQFIDQIIELVETLTGNITTEQDVRFIPLKYAWATDHEYSLGNSNVKVPGIATLLTNTYQTTSGENSTPTQKDDTNSKFNNALRVGKLKQQPAGKKATQEETIQIRSQQGLSDVNIVADPYHNAVIIRGPRNLLAQYEKLIKSLDTPVRIIEIEATIIDVDTDVMNELGTEWFGTYDNVDVGLGHQSTSQASLISALLGASATPIAGTPGLNLGVIVNDDIGLAARFSALESRGALKVISKPRVATLDDLEASIESSQSLYVSVPGAYEVDLFEVFSGTVLRVTPHIIDDDYDRKLRLLVSVQDGSLDISGGNSMPVTHNNSVNTQAIVKEGSSLLLGGMDREEQIVEAKGVPILSHIPILGNLFKYERKFTRKTERMFLITPRIVDYDGSIQTEDAVDISMELNEKGECIKYCKERYTSENIRIF